MWPRNLYALLPENSSVVSLADAETILKMQMFVGKTPENWEDICKAYYILGNPASKSLYDDLLFQYEMQLSKELEDMCLDEFDQWFEALNKVKKLAPTILSFGANNGETWEGDPEAEDSRWIKDNAVVAATADVEDSETVEIEALPETVEEIDPFLKQEERVISAKNIDDYFYTIDCLIKKFAPQKNALLQRVVDFTLNIQKRINNDIERSIDLLEVAINYAEQMMIDGIQDSQFIAAMYHVLGREYIKAGKIEEGLQRYQLAIEHYENNTFTKANCLGEYAKIYYDKKMWNEALRWFERARRCFRKSPKEATEKNLNAYDQYLLNCYLFIGELLHQEEKKEQAIMTLELGIEFGRRVLNELSVKDTRRDGILKTISNCQNEIDIISGKKPVEYVSLRHITETKPTETESKQTTADLKFFRRNSPPPRPETPAPELKRRKLNKK